MNRAALETWIGTHYGVQADHPWMRSPTYAVFRHADNQKWFAVIMDVPRNKLGMPGEKLLDVVNFKSNPILIGSLLGEPGFFPAYHMNKDWWITAALDGTVSEDKIKMLPDISYQATAPKPRGKGRRQPE